MTPKLNQKNLRILFFGGIVTFFVFISFYTLIRTLSPYQPISSLDAQILSLTSSLRTPLLNQIMLFITYIGSWPVVAFAFALVGLVLILLRQKHYLITLTVSILFGQAFVFFIKNLTTRNRPSFSQALTFEPSFSFPSAHAFVALSFYGLLTYFLYQASKSKIQKKIILFLGAFLSFLVAFSRIYLGAHWPSDVLASFVAGIIWIFTLISFNEFNQKQYPIIEKPFVSKNNINILVLFLCFIYEIFLILYFIANPINTPIPSKPIYINETTNFSAKLFSMFPNKTHSFINTQTKSINLIVIGQQDELEKCLLQIGLTKTTKTKTVSLWNSAINNLTFQKKSDIFVPFWQTKIKSKYKPVWVAIIPLDHETKSKLLNQGAIIENNVFILSL